jgi:hypothetical protein
MRSHSQEDPYGCDGVDTVFVKGIRGRNKFVGFYDKHSRQLRIDCPTDRPFWLEVDCSTILGLHQIEHKNEGPRKKSKQNVPGDTCEIQLVVKFLSGKAQVVSINKYSTVMDLKKQLQGIKDDDNKDLGMHPDQQKIIFEGTELKDEAELNHYRIQDSSILHFSISFCGR